MGDMGGNSIKQRGEQPPVELDWIRVLPRYGDFRAQRLTLLITSVLFYDTRIRNRAFHNLTDVTLTYEQVKILAMNSKFVPKPAKTSVESVLASLDDFARCLRLSERAKQQRYVKLVQGIDPDIDNGQPRYVPKFHIPVESAEAPALIRHVEMPWSEFASQLVAKCSTNRPWLLNLTSTVKNSNNYSRFWVTKI
ncbi:hypothetical protein B0H16DRAFT_1464868 [Mycena metata]|uniref:Uncharacterized protein n=1 Tax=Mycena metata TaxID=1033252 RepID=A0AAD7N0S8_9AGAR|nr:hypothetical protein B0H16DRAFT_1464868 [Mycena metata]